MKSVLFICLGNICRSPMAAAILQHKVNVKGINSEWYIDSAAIEGWNVGSKPDDRAVKCLRDNSITCTTDHEARQITDEDFTKFDIIFGMDQENMRDLNRLKPKDATAKLQLLGEYDPKKQLTITDPYYGQNQGFKEVFTQCERCCQAFLEGEMG